MKKIGIDLHGTIDADIRLYASWMEKAVVAGMTVHVVSGPPKDDIVRELDGHGLSLGLHYHHVESIVDHLLGSGVRMELRADGWWTNDRDWWGAKGAICREKGIDAHVDDQPGYGPGMPARTRFVLVGRHGINHAEGLAFLTARMEDDNDD